MRLPVAFPLLVCLAAGAARAGPEGGPDRDGPEAFLPGESEAADAALRSAAAAAAGGRAAAAAEAYQAVADGPLARRLAPSAPGSRSVENARERAHREAAGRPEVRAASAARFGPVAEEALGLAMARRDERALRDIFARYPLTPAGARAGAALARLCHRRGDPDAALGVLDRLLDLHPEGDPGGVARASLLALSASAAARTGEVEEQAAAAARARALDPGLGPYLDRLHDGAAPPTAAEPGVDLETAWIWRTSPLDRMRASAAGTVRPYHRSALPEGSDHAGAVHDGVVYWSDRHVVVAVDLRDGRERGRSSPGVTVPLTHVGTEPHAGESHAPHVDAGGVVALLDHPDGYPGVDRVGQVVLLDHHLTTLATRGGPGDPDDSFRARYVFHGRPLVAGDRIYVGATRTARGDEEGGGGDVRTHVLAFRRSDLAPVFDTYVAYGSGPWYSSVSPCGSPALRHGRLYVTTNTGVDACLDARTGTVLWAHRGVVPRLPASSTRLFGGIDGMEVAPLWPECAPAFAGPYVAFAPRNSSFLDICFQRPDPSSGAVLETHMQRPRRDRADLTALWVLGGGGGSFLVAGVAGPEEAPVALRAFDGSAEPDAVEFSVRWRAAIEESEVVAAPVRAGDAVYVATRKAVYRLRPRDRDGDAVRVAAFPQSSPAGRPPAPGNLIVLPDAILSVHREGIVAFRRAAR